MITVLVVDDCATDRCRASGLLTRAGYDVAVAADGRDALQRVQKQRPDAVVTDLQMPELDGLSLIAEIVRNFPLVPVVVMTSLGSETAAVQALQAGAASYVPKRDLASQLVETVNRVCTAAGEQREFARLAERVVRRTVRYELDSDVSLVPLVVKSIRELLSAGTALTELETLRVAVAFEEALLNAIYHGNLEVSSELRDDDPSTYYDLAHARSECPPYRDRQVIVDVTVTPEEARITVTDDGAGFDLNALPDPTAPENIARASGRGLLLIRTFMDELIHNPRGNEITMIKRFRPRTRTTTESPPSSTTLAEHAS